MNAETFDRDSRRLRAKQAAEYLKAKYGVGSQRWLAGLRCAGGGPRFAKFGRHPLYLERDLDEWAEGRLSASVRSTSELSTA